MRSLDDKTIVDSWNKNALQWTRAVRAGQIESRTLLTNKAIVESILSHNPDSVLDIGCGEGWLIRELAPSVSRLAGIDAVPDLISQAEAAGGGDFFVASYGELSDLSLGNLFDLVVCNFSLLGNESVDELFRSIPSLLKPAGVFMIQTLHPVVACGDLPYVDGWREGSWSGFGDEFVEPAPWYFRTLDSWAALFSASGFQLAGMREPIYPDTGQPASVIFTLIMN